MAAQSALDSASAPKKDAPAANNDELLDYEEEEMQTFSLADAKSTNKKALAAASTSAANAAGSASVQQIKGAYSSIHSSSFRDFLLKPELMHAIQVSGFEHPSTVQHETIPQAILGMDILCQAKSGMGKTAVFVISTLQLLNPKSDETSVLVIAHTRELALQISKEYERFSKYLNVKVDCFFGGMPITKDEERLKANTPHIVVGTPGRLLALARKKSVDFSKLKYFIIDEADKVLEAIDMRRDVQLIFQTTPKNKQIMMFSATMSREMQDLCKRFMQDPLEVIIGDDKQLILHGLHQYYVKLSESHKNKKLCDILDGLEFNQVVIFVKDSRRATALSAYLQEQNFPTSFIHGMCSQEDRISKFESFKDFKIRIIVSTDLFGRGIDVNKVNVVINYDMADSTDTYLHRVGRAGRFGTKGLAITFLADTDDCNLMNEVQKRFQVQIKDLPSELDPVSYTEIQQNGNDAAPDAKMTKIE